VRGGCDFIEARQPAEMILFIYSAEALGPADTKDC
jgi:hypothetical protein